MGDRSPAFNPPSPAKAPDNDSMIVRVPLDEMGWQNRKSQQPSFVTKTGISHVKNGK